MKLYKICRALSYMEIGFGSGSLCWGMCYSSNDIVVSSDPQFHYSTHHSRCNSFFVRGRIDNNLRAISFESAYKDIWTPSYLSLYVDPGVSEGDVNFEERADYAKSLLRMDYPGYRIVEF